MAKRIDTSKFVGMSFEQMKCEINRMNANEEIWGNTWETAVKPAAKAAGISLESAAIWWANQHGAECVPAMYHRKLGIR